MSLKTIFLVILVVVFGFSNVESVSNTSPTGYNKGSNTQQQVTEQSDEEKRIIGQQDLQKAVDYLNNCRKREVHFRKDEPSPKNEVAKQKRLKEQNEVDNLESNIREQISRLREIYERRLPLNKEYMQQLIIFHKNINDIGELFKIIEERRAQEAREYDERKISLIRQTINVRNQYEQHISTQQALVQDQNIQNKRVAEQEALKNVDKILKESLKNLEDWHKKGKFLNQEYIRIESEVQKNYDTFKLTGNLIDKRREQERLDEIQRISKLKNDLNTMKIKEEEDRKNEPPASGMAFVERKKEEFTYHRLVEAIEKQIGVVEKMLQQKSFLDKEYAHQKKILTDRWDQLESLKLRMKQRREKEASARMQEKMGQQQINNLLVQQQQQRTNNPYVQQQIRQGTINVPHMNTQINKKRPNGK